jgi:exodeoxyribonuclease VII small subunit
MAKKKLTFEQALQELEEIAQQIEEGSIGLEESIRKYEEGMSLVKQCRGILDKAELRVQKLQEQEDGRLEAKPMEAPAAGPQTATNDGSSEDEVDG